MVEVNPDTYGELKFLGRELNEYWKQVQDNAEQSLSDLTTTIYFDYDAVERGYHSYRHDDLLDYLYDEKYSKESGGGGCG